MTSFQDIVAGETRGMLAEVGAVFTEADRERIAELSIQAAGLAARAQAGEAGAAEKLEAVADSLNLYRTAAGVRVGDMLHERVSRMVAGVLNLFVGALSKA